ncbi:MAG TPA: EAL domain-containing protein [Candidatus Omnitrophota bacterium]|nr:EAL domain-containing protein [Candidatus Omnitrophota bacterium]
MKKKKVLIVDDEKNVAKTLVLLLETRGYAIDVAETGQQALQKATQKPDIILLDLVLPDISGFEICRKLREQKDTKQIPIIILSVRYLYEDKIEGLYLGADDYITKPFEYEELFARMEAVMRRREAFDSDTEEQNAMIVELRTIIDKQLLIPFFQPIFYLKPFRLCGLEVLSRPPAKSILANPEVLFAAALRFGVYYDLEILGWRKAMQEILRSDYQDKIFLNSNPYLVESTEFSRIRTLIESFNIDKHRIVFEITERSAIKDYRIFFDRLKEYQRTGFGVAIDDIGGGYASLESIVEILPQFVKIDMSIIRDLDTNSLKRSMVRFIVGLCKENNITCVAEGIERQEELNVLLELGIDAGQGYLLGMPSPVINIQEISRRDLSI